MSTAAAFVVVKTRLLVDERDELARLAELDGRSVASYLARLIRYELEVQRVAQRGEQDAA